jgi:hypothetical protein
LPEGAQQKTKVNSDEHRHDATGCIMGIVSVANTRKRVFVICLQAQRERNVLPAPDSAHESAFVAIAMEDCEQRAADRAKHLGCAGWATGNKHAPGMPHMSEQSEFAVHIVFCYKVNVLPNGRLRLWRYFCFTFPR